ncbi:YceI family protein [Sanguibacter suaedae]|uniref:YceI family protein n=1 Tax=Sanguibacter suaedae TaxID=2795737 RepID=A0A934IA39_9MICO|nr:YceI family protein [Sanguibacter suaedae]MBI9114111.1 YceI family protein [Sanguibacter suaedae]
MPRKLLIAVAGVVTVVLLVVVGTAVYVSVQNDKAPEELALSDTEDATDGTATLTEDDLAGEWQVSDGSEAGYRVEEVLNGQDVTVVGRTSDVDGTFTVEGTELTAADVEVSMTTITSDSGNRDGQFLDILRTEEHPTATFTLTEPVDVADVVDGTVSVQAAGEMTIAGQTQEVVVDLQAQATADGVEVSGTLPVAFSDYGIDAPDLGFVKVEDTGTVEMLLTLSK